MFRVFRVFFKVFSESKNVVVDGSGRWKHIVAPNSFQNCFARQNLVSPFYKKPKQFHFAFRKLNFFSFNTCNGKRLKIDFAVSEPERRTFLSFAFRSSFLLLPLRFQILPVATVKVLQSLWPLLQKVTQQCKVRNSQKTKKIFCFVSEQKNRCCVDQRACDG